MVPVTMNKLLTCSYFVNGDRHHEGYCKSDRFCFEIYQGICLYVKLLWAIVTKKGMQILIRAESIIKRLQP